MGNLAPHHKELLKSKFISRENPNYPEDAIHIFAENQPASKHNQKMLNNIKLDEINIEAVDKIPQNIPTSQMETGGLAQNLILKLHAKVMLTSNIAHLHQLSSITIILSSDNLFLNMLFLIT